MCFRATWANFAAMDLVIEHTFQCPHCGQEISRLLDLSVEAQSYVEDCEVCCRPIEIEIRTQAGALTSFQAST